MCCGVRSRLIRASWGGSPLTTVPSSYAAPECQKNVLPHSVEVLFSRRSRGVMHDSVLDECVYIQSTTGFARVLRGEWRHVSKCQLERRQMGSLTRRNFEGRLS